MAGIGSCTTIQPNELKKIFDEQRSNGNDYLIKVEQWGIDGGASLMFMMDCYGSSEHAYGLKKESNTLPGNLETQLSNAEDLARITGIYDLSKEFAAAKIDVSELPENIQGALMMANLKRKKAEYSRLSFFQRWGTQKPVLDHVNIQEI